MKVLLLLIVALAMAPVSSARSSETKPTLVVSPSPALASGVVTLSGCHFTPGETVTIRAAYQPYGGYEIPAVVGADGCFSSPIDSYAGDWIVTVDQYSPRRTASISFTIF